MWFMYNSSLFEHMAGFVPVMDSMLELSELLWERKPDFQRLGKFPTVKFGRFKSGKA